MLNERELEVLGLIGQAKSNREIAAELFLSVNSVKSRVRKAYRKIGVHSRSEAVIWAVHHEIAATHPGRSPTPRQRTASRPAGTAVPGEAGERILDPTPDYQPTGPSHAQSDRA